jgi:hypothetical protein
MAVKCKDDDIGMHVASDLPTPMNIECMSHGRRGRPPDDDEDLELDSVCAIGNSSGLHRVIKDAQKTAMA